MSGQLDKILAIGLGHGELAGRMNAVGATSAEVADRSGISVRNIQRWKKGEKPVPTSAAMKLHRALVEIESDR